MEILRFPKVLKASVTNSNNINIECLLLILASIIVKYLLPPTHQGTGILVYTLSIFSTFGLTTDKMGIIITIHQSESLRS